MYAGVPIVCPIIVNGAEVVRSPPASPSETRLAIPKSRTFTEPDDPIMMLLGFRSRCTIPASCAALSASATCSVYSMARTALSGPPDSTWERGSPRTYSITMKSRPSAVLIS